MATSFSDVAGLKHTEQMSVTMPRRGIVTELDFCPFCTAWNAFIFPGFSSITPRVFENPRIDESDPSPVTSRPYYLAEFIPQLPVSRYRKTAKSAILAQANQQPALALTLLRK